MVNIDGVNRKCEWVKDSLTLEADIMNGENSGRMQGSWSMYLDYIGTYFSYKGQLRRTADCTDEEFYEIYLQLIRPNNKHTIVFPFGQRKLSQEVYISKISWKLIDYNPDDDRTLASSEVHRGYHWEKVLEVTFSPIHAMWKAGGSLRGIV